MEGDKSRTLWCLVFRGGDSSIFWELGSFLILDFGFMIRFLVVFVTVVAELIS